TPKISPHKENNKIGIKVVRDDGKKFFIDGDLAETSEIELFLEDVEKNPHIARSLASLAMYLSARAQLGEVGQ
ncbi:MAG: hypothetical protein QFX34_03695, partial [Candidatus Verstraetearchaeota archaeon]|nr:hypothetical protein [Candidatus Verstraetearchaeota archaeon]